MDLLFPPNCAGCGKIGSRWCTECQNKIIFLSEPFCEICGYPQKRNGTCISCLHSRPPYEALRSWVVFDGPIRGAIHQLKYHRNLGLGDTLSEVLVSSIQELRWSVDQIIPIPLSNQRYKERGYNQIAIVAFPLSLQLNINFSSKALLRKKHTRSQVGLSAEERKANVEGAFWADPEKVKEKTILI